MDKSDIKTFLSGMGIGLIIFLGIVLLLFGITTFLECYNLSSNILNCILPIGVASIGVALLMLSFNLWND